MKNIFKFCGKRLLAGIMAVATVITALPLQSLAAELRPMALRPDVSTVSSGVSTISIDVGGTGYTLYGKNFEPSDGNMWGGSDVTNSSFYYRYYDRAAKEWKVGYHKGTNDASRLLMCTSPTASSGEYAICLEAGKDFEDGTVYKSKTIAGSDWDNMMASGKAKGYSGKNADQYIALAMYYGLNSANRSAVSGSNADDWIIATQVIVWELQQGIIKDMNFGGDPAYNSDPNFRHNIDLGSGRTLSGMTFQIRLGGSSSTRRSKVYNWILRHVRAESKKPSFDGTTLTLKYNSSTGKYTGSVTDTNATDGIYHTLTCLSGSGVSVSRSGNTYTFTASAPISGTVKFGHSSSSDNNMRVYESNDSMHQIMANGRTNPMNYSLNVKTSLGSLRIVKKFSGDTPTADEIEKVAFKVKNSSGQYVNASAQATTGAGRGIYTYTGTSSTGTTFYINGSSHAFKISDLPIGTYTVTETSNLSKWKEGAAVNVTVKVGATTEKDYTNTREKGSCKITKKWVNNGDATQNYDDVYFIIAKGSSINGDKVIASGSAGSYTYASTTSGTGTSFKLNSSNNLTISNLPTGTYTVQERGRGTNYAIPDYTRTKATQTVTVQANETGTVSFKNTRNTGYLHVLKEWNHKKGQTASNSDIYFTVEKEGKYVVGVGAGPSGVYNFSKFVTAVGSATKFKLGGSTDTGYFWLQKLPTGVYVIREYGKGDGGKIPGYTRKQTAITVTVKAGDSTDDAQTVTFTNDRDDGDAEILKTFDGKQGTEAQNQACEFTVKEKSSGKYVNATKKSSEGAGVYTYSGLSSTATKFKLEKDSSSGWRFLLSGLPTGTYTVTETKSPNGYTPETTSKAVTVTKGTTKSVTFNNTTDEGGLKIVKKWIPSDGSSLDQAEFEKNNGLIRFTIKNTATNKYPGLSGSNGDSKRAFSGVWHDDPLEYKVNAESGTLEVTDLPAGTYEVEEIIKDTTLESEWSKQYKKTSTVSGGKTVTYSFTNTQGISIEITKIFKNSGNLSAEELKKHYQNVQFRVSFSPSSNITIYWNLTGSNGKYKYSTTSTDADNTWYSLDANGKAVIDLPSSSGLGPFYYTFEERYTGTDYNIDEPKSILADYDSTGFKMPLQEVTFTNTPKNGNLEVIKSFKENNADVEVTDEQVNSVGFIVSKGSQDVTFNGSNGSYTYSGTTDGTGTVLSLATSTKKLLAEQLPVGTYTIREVNGADGFKVAVSEEQTFTVSAAKTATVQFTNEPMRGTISIKKNSKDGVLAGWQFRVECISSPFKGYTYNQTHMTNTEGKITLNNLRIGTYRVTEVTTGKEAYITPESQQDEVEYNRTTEFIFENIPLGTVKAIKYDEDNHDVKLHGAKFEVRAAENITMVDGTRLFAKDARAATLSENGTTGEYVLDNTVRVDGKTTNKLPYGKYYLVETTAPANYELDTTRHDFAITKAGEEIPIEVDDPPQEGTLVIQKRSPDGKVQGWQFRVELVSSDFEGYTYNKTFTTGVDGSITISNLRIGTYKVTELATADQQAKYFIADVQDTTITRNNSITVYGDNIDKGSVHLTKEDIDTKVLLTGAEFTVYAAEDVVKPNGTVTYAEDAIVGKLKEIATGEYKLTDLPHGEYYLKETKAPANYVLDTKEYTFSIDEAGETEDIVTDYYVVDDVFLNQPQVGSLVINKRTNDGIIENWKFRVRCISSPFEGYTYDHVFATGADGTITIKNLRIGTYEVTEVTNDPADADKLAGYITPTQQELVVKTDATTTADFENIPIGSVTITKVDSDIADVKLHGAKFEIHAAENITMVNGTQLFAKDAVVGTMSEDGTTGIYKIDTNVHVAGQTTNKLPYGKYYIVETTAPMYYELDVTRHSFEITQANQELPPIIVSDPPQVGTLVIQKRSTDGKVEGWKFRVQLVSSNFEGYTYDKTFTTGADGTITIPELRIGKYKITEVVSAEQTGKYFTADVVNTEITRNNTVTIYGDNIDKGNVHLTKKDIDTKELMSGAEFTVYAAERVIKPNGTVTYEKDAVVGKLKETSKGEYKLTDIPHGKYYLVETKAPANYVKDDNKYNFTIDVAGETEEITTKYTTTDDAFLNTPQTGTLIITKTALDSKVQGWQFRVQSKTTPFVNWSYDKTFTTGEDGKITITGLRIGTYTITELTTGKTGYIFATDQEAEIRYNTTTEKTFENIPIGNVHVTKVDLEYPDSKLTGAEFTVYAAKDVVTVAGKTLYAKGVEVGKLVEIADGEYQLNDLPYGDYILKETKAPANYIPDDTEYPFTIRVAGVTVPVESTPRVGLENKPQRGNLSIRKISPDGVIQGWKFRIQLISSPFESYTYDNTYTTDSNGVINLYGIRIGTYKVTELASGEQAKLYITADPQQNTVQWNKLTVMEFTNIPLGNVHVTKVDSELDVKLTGAEFTVYNYERDEVVGKLKEIEEGEYQLNDIPYGNYWLKETKSPVGFVPDDSYYPFAIRVAGDTVYVGNAILPAFIDEEVVEGDMEWTEKVFEQPTSGIVIGENGNEVRYPTANSEILGNYPNGSDILIAGLTDSYYKTANGGFIGLDEVRLNAISSDFADKPIRGDLEIIKTDISYGTPIEGVGYCIRNEQGEIVAEGYTDAEGKLTFNLRYGKYTFEEFDEQDGYFPNHNEYPFEITENDQIIKADMTNEQFPKIGTTATIGEDKDAIAQGMLTLNDVVAYHALVPGREYILKGILMDKATGEAFTVDGEPITAETVFTPEAPDGEVNVVFVFSADGITEHTTLVAFETLYVGNTEYAVHADINDKDQTIELHKPDVKTTATSNGEKENIAVGEITIDDVVKYTDLIVGKEYTVKGILMNKTTGEAFIVDGKEITAEATFTAETEDGEIILSFTFDGSAITENTKLVAFETLYMGDVEIVMHTDIDDEDQTVELHRPEIKTTATTNDEKENIAVGTVTIKDVVAYYDLIAGKEYTVKGTLMDKATGEALLINGKPITSEATFVAETTDGAVEVVFVFDTSVLETTTTLVAFESLTWNDLEVATHTDINDVDQTVKLYKPEIKTNATSNGEKDVIAVGKVTIDDVVTYHDLIVGKEYTVKGTLMDKATGEVFLVDGKEITAEATFIPETNDGEVKLSFTFDGPAITKNTELVVFERLYKDDIEIAVHTDINDTDQTVDLHKPEVKTTATTNGEKETIAVGTVTIDDVVKYSDLVVGKEYTVKGTLMDKSTGKAFTVNGKEVTSETTFTAETEDGEITLSFTFDANSIAKNTELVAFERLYNDDIEIAVHTDINDTDQTVKLYKPEIGTKATVNGKKEVTAVGTITIDDVVEYHDLIVGKEYTIKGTLMNKATGEAFMVNGKPVTAETTFTAKTTDGEVTVSFTFDASAVTADTKVVAFETLYHNDVEIAVHADINDEDQTVTLEIPEVPEVPATGVGVDTTAAATAALAAGIAIVMMLKRKRK